MKKITLSIFTSSLIFVLGLLSGNLISFPATQQKPTALHTDLVSTDVAGTTDATVHDNKTNTSSDFDSFIQLASLSDFENADAGLELAAASVAVERPTADQTRVAIEALFPHLDKQTLAGWVDAYGGMPLDELTEMLQQKQLMPSIIPNSSFFGPNANGIAAEPGTETTEQTTIVHCRTNLRHAHTIGYRRTQTLSTISPQADSDDIAYRFEFDFRPGVIEASSAKLHVAIEGNRNVMFRLKPGNILTRCGLFERQADGSLGIGVGDSFLQVEGTTALPLDATELSISSDGTVSYRDVEHERQTAGQISLFKISNLAELLSEDGVYFTAAADSEPQQQLAPDAVSLVPESLEMSNVERNEEWQLLDHFERLAKLAQQMPN